PAEAHASESPENPGETDRTAQSPRFPPLRRRTGLGRRPPRGSAMTLASEARLRAAPQEGFPAISPAQRSAIRLVHIAACVAGLVLIGLAIGLATYNYKHAWLSAHYAVMANAFNTFGLFDLGFVPVQNNPPLTTSPDAYLHWPPLYPV